jgi:hypothetical protein
MIKASNIVALATHGRVISIDSSMTPQAPSLSLVSSGTSIIATITGAENATHILKYKGSSDTSWQSAGSRQGDGIITVTGLGYNIPYIFICYSQIDGGVYSLPAVALAATLAAASTDLNPFDAANIASVDAFLNAAGTIRTYLPRNGGSRPIKVIIDYGQISNLPGVDSANSGTVSITVANDATKGISTAEFDGGGDMINIPWPHEYSSPQNRYIKKPISQDAGMVTYEVR